MTNELEHKPIVGDDGELIEPDQKVDMRSYNTYVDFLRRIAARQPDQNPVNLLFMIIPGLALGILILFMLSNIAQQRDTKAVTPTANNAPLTTPIANIPFQTGSRDKEHDVEAIKWVAPAHNLLVFAANQTRFIWDVDQNALGGYLTGFQLRRKVFDWSPDRKFSICQSDGIPNIIYRCDSQIRIVSTIVPVQGFRGVPRLIRWSPDGTKLAIIYELNNLEIITIDNQLLESGQAPETLTDFTWTSDSKRLMAISEGKLWHWYNGQTSIGFLYPYANQKLRQVQESPSGKQLAVALQDGSNWFFLVTQDGQTLWKTPLPDIAYQDDLHIAWSPNSKWIATFVDSTFSKQVILWNPLNGAIVKTIKVSSGITSLDWSLDSQYLAVAGHFGVTIWSPE